jgi:hypothetical protein
MPGIAPLRFAVAVPYLIGLRIRARGGSYLKILLLVRSRT